MSQNKISVRQIGADIGFNRANDNAYYAMLLRLAEQLPPPRDFDAEALGVFPDLIARADRAVGFKPMALIPRDKGLVWKPVEAGQPALYWDGDKFTIAAFPGHPTDWVRERAAYATEIVSLATELEADSLVEIGAGFAPLAMFISRLTRLPIVNLDASSEALAVAEIFRARSQLQWRNIRVDVARMLARPEDQVALQAELPGSRPHSSIGSSASAQSAVSTGRDRLGSRPRSTSGFGIVSRRRWRSIPATSPNATPSS